MEAKSAGAGVIRGEDTAAPNATPLPAAVPMQAAVPVLVAGLEPGAGTNCSAPCTMQWCGGVVIQFAAFG